ncbi:MAG: glutathione-disulfide reductase [Pseudomonadota bacterium]
MNSAAADHNYDYDLVVLGAGSGGVRAARMAATHGARVAVVENRFLGGTCVNVGCVPKKLFVYGSHFAEDFATAAGYGWQLPRPDFDWPTLRDNKTREIERLNGVYANLLDGAGVERVWGTATFVDPHHVAVGERTLSADRVLIATGGRPVVPDIPGREHALVSDDLFYLDALPRRAAVVGGGYIGVEFAGILNGLGVETHLLYRRELFLRGFDQSIREFVRDELSAKGIHLHFNINVDAIEATASGKGLKLTDGSYHEVDQVLFATGRVPNTDGLNIEASGVALGSGGEVLVDEQYQTSVPNIYALGDVTDRVQLTPVAIAEAMVLTDNLYTDKPPRTLDYDNIATAVFCQPNIGTVGLTEKEARAQLGEIRVFESNFRPMKYTLTDNTERTLMKLIVNAADDRVVGAHMAGPEAGEIIQGLAIALKAQLTKAQFDQTIGIHPTAAEEFVTMRTARA